MPNMRKNDQKRDRAMLTQATEIITINAGGCHYMTCKNTLLSSGARFFQDMFKQAETVLEKERNMYTSVDNNNNKSEGLHDYTKLEKKTSEKHVPSPNTTIFLDCDPYIFSEVLYFMRCNRIAPETKASPLRLEKLQIEAEFFSYDTLFVACNRHLETIKKSKEESLKNKPSARSGSVATSEGDDKVIYVPDGQVIFISSATLAGECRMRSYEGYDGSKIPGYYINTCEKEHSGDFQLHYYHMNSEGRNYSHLRCSIAHVGLDRVHCENMPLNVNFREDLRICISPQPGYNWIALGSSGAGTWHVHYWIGHPNAIPDLRTSSDQGLATGLAIKKRKLHHYSPVAVDKKSKEASVAFISKRKQFSDVYPIDLEYCCTGSDKC